MRHKLAVLAGSDLRADELKHLTAIQEEIVERMSTVPELSPLQTSDLEDKLTDWLDDNGASSGWEIAPTFVAGGVGLDDLQRIADALSTDYLDGALRWLAYTVETELLLGEIENATGRISALVGAAKQYSQMDRSSHQSVDVHDGLNSTLIMLSRKIGDQVKVVKDYDCSLPKIPAYAAELNQVWTNLIDNAVDAMRRSGTLTLHTARDGEQLLVEIRDTGPGVPDNMHQQIFEPFFTTKPVGEGTGLGLDVSWRIVVNRHGGSMRVISEPGDTRFQVRLPLTESTHHRQRAAS
jgi:signal transduction histidine kinase